MSPRNTQIWNAIISVEILCFRNKNASITGQRINTCKHMTLEIFRFGEVGYITLV